MRRGLVLDARILEITDKGTARLSTRLGEAEVPLAALREAARQPGAAVRVSVEAVDRDTGRVTLSVGPEPAPIAAASDPALLRQRALAEAAARALSRQTGLATLYATVERLAALPPEALPHTLRAAVSAVLTQRLEASPQAVPEAVRRAVAGSGIFLESGLAAGRPVAETAPDLKAALVRLTAALGDYLAAPSDPEPAETAAPTPSAPPAGGGEGQGRTPVPTPGPATGEPAPTAPEAQPAAAAKLAAGPAAAESPSDGVALVRPPLLAPSGGPQGQGPFGTPGTGPAVSVSPATVTSGGPPGGADDGPAGVAEGRPAPLATPPETIPPSATRPPPSIPGQGAAPAGQLLPPAAPGAAQAPAPATAPALAPAATFAAESEPVRSVPSPPILPIGPADPLKRPADASSATLSAAAPVATRPEVPARPGAPGPEPQILPPPVRPPGDGPEIRLADARMLAQVLSVLRPLSEALGRAPARMSQTGAAPARAPAEPGQREAPRDGQAPPPPLRGGPTRGEPPTPSHLAGDAQPRDLARAALGEAEGALSRITLSQIASVPPDPEAPAAGAAAQAAPPPAQWTFEVPVRLPEGTGVAQFQVERDGRGAAAEADGPTWRIRFSVDIALVGPVHARLSLVGQHLSVGIWTERPEAADLLAVEVAHLRQALEGASLAVDEIHLAAGRPPQAGDAAPGAGRFVDRSA
ncbi:flagellar hook-length control protein FliK [Prosthecomicrobium sp. N25]|uniref:flagellar hook-length control protein FliK n=1 Tax=Prosthecomicrobium sp. N25 TaxID=3129254 RepID=UPI0030776C4B